MRMSMSLPENWARCEREVNCELWNETRANYKSIYLLQSSKLEWASCFRVFTGVESWNGNKRVCTTWEPRALNLEILVLFVISKSRSRSEQSRDFEIENRRYFCIFFLFFCLFFIAFGVAYWIFKNTFQIFWKLLLGHPARAKYNIWIFQNTISTCSW
jgi:hypothetical protein